MKKKAPKLVDWTVHEQGSMSMCDRPRAKKYLLGPLGKKAKLVRCTRGERIWKLPNGVVVGALAQGRR